VQEDNVVGTRSDRLTPKEIRIEALIVHGCKNRQIATRLKTTEQVIRNYLRNIYDKTGVSDRLGLVVFTFHHRVLVLLCYKRDTLLRLFWRCNLLGSTLME
jgi:DNA-binding NarL/FixJ family response regulator